MLRPQADFAHDGGDSVLAFATARLPVYAKGLANNATHRHAGMQGGIGVLKNDLHLAPQLTHGLRLQRGDVHALEYNLARSGLDEPQYRPPGGRFATAALAH